MVACLSKDHGIATALATSWRSMLAHTLARALTPLVRSPAFINVSSAVRRPPVYVPPLAFGQSAALTIPQLPLFVEETL